MYLFHSPRAMTSDTDRGDEVLDMSRRHVDDSGTGRRADVLDAARCRRPNPKLVVEKGSSTPNWNLRDPRQVVLNRTADPAPVNRNICDDWNERKRERAKKLLGGKLNAPSSRWRKENLNNVIKQ